MRIEVEITWNTDQITEWKQTRIFLNREHVKTYINYLKQNRGYECRGYEVLRAVNPRNTNDNFYEEEEEDEDCESCQGTGESGPYGYEFPEYENCTDCRGSGKQSGCPDPDHRYDQKIDFPL